MSTPTHPDAFTNAWLENALGAPIGSLKGFSAKPVGTGQMSLTFRVKLDWKNGEGPASLIAKCPAADARTRQIAQALRCYALELGWYRELAPKLDVACPACLHLECDDADETTFALLLEDLSPSTQGDQLVGASIAQIEAALRQAARLHAPYWGKPALHEIAWLQPASSTTAMVRQMLAPLYVQFRERYATRLAPDLLEMGDAFVARADSYFDLKPVATTIQHRDFRIDNILYSPDGARAHVVDWQTLGIGAGAADVAYLIGTSIANAEERAREEERLVRFYVEEVRTLGAAPDADAIWREYKLYAFSGFLMAIIASMNVGRTERGDEMFAVMAERPALQVLHLDSLSLL
jgi:hypothetical protein